VLIPESGKSGKGKPIHQVHGIIQLFDFFKQIVTQNESALAQVAKTDWQNILPELGQWLSAIDQADSASTFFRYPVTKNQEGDIAKSSMQQTTPEEVLAEIQTGGKPAKVFMVLEDDNDKIVGMYHLTETSLGNLEVALKVRPICSADLISA
jgi:hypothetical protein